MGEAKSGKTGEGQGIVYTSADFVGGVMCQEICLHEDAAAMLSCVNGLHFFSCQIMYCNALITCDNAIVCCVSVSKHKTDLCDKLALSRFGEGIHLYC